MANGSQQSLAISIRSREHSSSDDDQAPIYLHQKLLYSLLLLLKDLVDHPKSCNCCAAMLKLLKRCRMKGMPELSVYGS